MTVMLQHHLSTTLFYQAYIYRKIQHVRVMLISNLSNVVHNGFYNCHCHLLLIIYNSIDKGNVISPLITLI